MKITKQKLRDIIKEELEVILTDDEASELFGDQVENLSEMEEPAGSSDKTMRAVAAVEKMALSKEELDDLVGMLQRVHMDMKT
jgi:hypothetical protein